MCWDHIKETKPDVSGWSGKQTKCPYTCMSCGCKTGWSWIEPKHNCKNPMFDKNGKINLKYIDTIDKETNGGKGVPPTDKSVGIPPTIL